MKRRQVHIMLTNQLMALVLVESDRSGDSIAAIIRRCVRGQLAELAGTKAYQQAYDVLQREAPEDE